MHEETNPINEISKLQKSYFALLKENLSHFGPIDELSPTKVNDFVERAFTKSVILVPVFIEGRPLNVNACSYYFERLVSEVREFWEKNWSNYIVAMVKLEGYTISLGAMEDIPDPGIQSVVSKYGAFFDFIAIPDAVTGTLRTGEILMLSKMFSGIETQKTVLRQIYLYLCYEHFFCSSKEHPVLLLLPQGYYTTAKNPYVDLSHKCTETFRTLASEFLGKELEELRDCSLYDLAKNESFAMMSWGTRDASALQKYAQAQRSRWTSLYGSKIPQMASDNQWLLATLFKKVFLMHVLAADCVAYNYDAAITQTNWLLYSWLMRVSSKETAILAGKSLSESDIFRFGVESPDLGWLQSVPADQILEIRKDNTIQQIREDFRTSRCKVRRAPSGNLSTAIEEAGSFLSDSLLRHADKLRLLRKQTITTLLVKGVATAIGIGITVAAAVYPPLAIPGAIISVVGSKGLYDFAKATRAERNRLLAEKRRPLGILLKLKELTNENQMKLGSA